MSLLTLSTELLQLMASSLKQQELLNLSLTCKRLRLATEPELFREYSNVSQFRRSFLPFLKRIIHRPELRRHTRKLSLRSWTALNTLQDRGLESNETRNETRNKRHEHISAQGAKLTAADYILLVQAARDVEVIQEDAELDCSTCNSQIVNETRCGTATVLPNPNGVHLCNRTFCDQLHAGSEDPLVVLLVALLPNVREITLDGVPGDMYAVSWQPKHGFPELRTLVACAVDGELQWPLDFFQPLLASSRLRVLKASHATSRPPQLTRHQPMIQELSQLALVSRTLVLERIELENCCLRVSDLQSLLQCCSGLRSFLYTTRRCGLRPWSPSPADFVELLRPHETTLHTLILDVDVHYYEDKVDQRRALIQSLSHMTALKVLVTAPEMWHCVAVGDVMVMDSNVRWEEWCLSMRVPPNVETLVFGLSEAEMTASPSQLSDLILMHPVYVEVVKQIHLDLQPLINTGQQELQVHVGCIYVRSIFDTRECPNNRSEVIWVDRISGALRLPTPARYFFGRFMEL
ncbi:hypothetical protein J3E74DRAFT_295642 [Bipolaris maydis]|nr:hypothetical protein J3E74DRAFT_296022 [Bipolaris maydis]KAJ5052549.1 hypothetical protein J3E74DRAFT_295642 [Bipolaris maydis]